VLSPQEETRSLPTGGNAPAANPDFDTRTNTRLPRAHPCGIAAPAPLDPRRWTTSRARDRRQLRIHLQARWPGPTPGPSTSLKEHNHDTQIDSYRPSYSLGRSNNRNLRRFNGNASGTDAFPGARAFPCFSHTRGRQIPTDGKQHIYCRCANAAKQSKPVTGRSPRPAFLNAEDDDKGNSQRPR
jgi:hypothetical protein